MIKFDVNQVHSFYFTIHFLIYICEVVSLVLISKPQFEILSHGKDGVKIIGYGKETHSYNFW